MITQYKHNLMTSFYLWFDHCLIERGSAFINKTSNFYYDDDDRLGGKIAYASPYKQWVAENYGNVLSPSISGATGVISNGIVDYENGRIVLDTGYGSGLNLSGSYSVKELNVYMIEDHEAEGIFEKNYLNNRYIIYESGVKPYEYAMPACFIMQSVANNKPFCLDGEENSVTSVRVVVATNNIYDLDACLSLFSDLSHSHFALVEFDDMPYNEYGDLKASFSGNYNYWDLITTNQQRLVYISDVRTSKFTSYFGEKVNPSMFAGIIDFTLNDLRYPRQ